MREQYEHLTALAGAGTVELRVLPFAVGPHPGVYGPFTILDFANPEDHVVAHTGSYAGSQYHDRDAQDEAHRHVYRRLHEQSVPLEEFPL